ncbi:MAG: nitroreductase [Eubacteriales bacterium]|nr:nitroreductase [Eubacteriales bacterium]
MNEVIKNLLERRSIRKFIDKEISKEDLDLILKAGTFAPTASGKQSPTMVVINGNDLNELEKINAEIYGKNDHPFYGAKLAILVLGDATNKNTIYDGSLVMGNLMNAAHSLGIGSCWIHRAKETFEREDGKKFLKKWGLSGEYTGIGYCILGYADSDSPKPAERKENYVIFA